MMRKLPFTRKVLALIIAAVGVTGTVSAIFLANFIVPSTVTITGAPGMIVNDAAGGGTLTSLTWGDVQETTSATHQITISDTGLTALWIVDSTTSGVESLTTNPNLPNGVTLTWDLTSKYGVQACTGQVSGTTVTGCLLLQPGQNSGLLTLTLSVAANAALGSASFQTVFSAYSTPTG